MTKIYLFSSGKNDLPMTEKRTVISQIAAIQLTSKQTSPNTGAFLVFCVNYSFQLEFGFDFDTLNV